VGHRHPSTLHALPTRRSSDLGDGTACMIQTSQGRLQDRRPLSIIDIGSNSIRLVVYEGVARSPTVLFNEKMLAGLGRGIVSTGRSEEHTSELQSRENLVCRLL